MLQTFRSYVVTKTGAVPWLPRSRIGCDEEKEAPGRQHEENFMSWASQLLNKRVRGKKTDHGHRLEKQR